MNDESYVTLDYSDIEYMLIGTILSDKKLQRELEKQVIERHKLPPMPKKKRLRKKWLKKYKGEYKRRDLI